MPLHADSLEEDSSDREREFVNQANLTPGRELLDASRAQSSPTEASTTREEEDTSHKSKEFTSQVDLMATVEDG